MVAGVSRKYLFEILVYVRWLRSNENVTAVVSKRNHRIFDCNGIKWSNKEIEETKIIIRAISIIIKISMYSILRILDLETQNITLETLKYVRLELLRTHCGGYRA